MTHVKSFYKDPKKRGHLLLLLAGDICFDESDVVGRIAPSEAVPEGYGGCKPYFRSMCPPPAKANVPFSSVLCLILLQNPPNDIQQNKRQRKNKKSRYIMNKAAGILRAPNLGNGRKKNDPCDIGDNSNGNGC